MQTPHTAAPGAPATRLAVIRSTALPFLRPDRGLPMDGDAGGGAGGAGGAGTATIAPSAAGGDGGGQVPATPPAGVAAPPHTSQPPGQPADTSSLFEGLQGEAAGRAAAAGQPQAGQPAAAPTPTQPPAPAGERSLDQFPPEIRDYIAELRKESGDNRIKAKTAEDQAAEKMRGWLDGIAKVFGLVEDAPDDVPPEQRVAQLGDQLTAAQTEHRAAQVELAIWKAAAAAEANPTRLTDSRTFMRSVSGLDPSAADFDQQVTAAIGTALAADTYFKAAGQVPPAAPPPVASGGNFGGGPAGGQNTGPQTVDDFREEMRNRRSRT